jgi:acyl-coenzyme A thioesterase PaaI-like protein
LTLSHHELCFGCGSANLFGLQMELEAVDGGVAGRCFVKQDHQGPGGRAHPGVVAAALQEAMALALHEGGVHAQPRRVEVVLSDEAPVGIFLGVEARVVENGGSEELTVVATATAEEQRVAEARGVFLPLE